MSDCDNIVIGICGGSKLTFSDMPCDNLRIEGADDVTINQGAGIDLTDGVHAYDGNGNEIPFTVEPDEIDKCEVGEHIVKYTAEGEGDMMLPTLCGKNRLHISSMCDNAILQEERVVTITQADPPVISGADGMEVNVGTVFDPMDGVSAVDDNGNEIEVEISGTYPRTANGEQLVSFDDGNGSLAESVKVTFEPYQSGTPSLAGTDTTPYIYRSAPSFGQAYNRQRPVVVGGSVGWNQLVADAYIAVPSGTYAWNQIASYAKNKTLEANHVYLLQSDNSELAVRFRNESLSIVTANGQRIIYKAPTTDDHYYVQGNGTTTKESHVNYHDLTALWGSTVADAIYAMEQATAGSGVAFFKSLFGEDYYAYNSGSLESVQTSAHVIHSKNLLQTTAQTQTISGVTFTVNSDGSITANGRATSLVLFVLNDHLQDYLEDKARYILSGSPVNSETNKWKLRVFNGDDYIDTGNGVQFTFFSTANTKKCDIVVYSGTTMNNVTFYPMIRSASMTDATYEPYHEWSYPLDPIVLRGVPKWENGALKYDGDTYESDGTVTRRYGIVDLGTLTWNAYTQSGEQMFLTNLSDTAIPATTSVIANAICSDKLSVTSANRLLTTDDKIIAIGTYFTALRNINAKMNSVSTADEFKTAVSGTYLVYELTTPTTESADPYTALQMADPNGTEEWVDNRTVKIPVGQITEYRTVYDIEGYDEIDTYVSGTNLWNEQWEVGEYNIVTGEKTGSSGVRCKSPIPIVGDTTYRLYCASRDTEMYGYCFYDSEGNFIEGSLTTGSTITAPSNAKYVSFFMPNSWYGSVYQNDISVNYPSSEVGQFPYVGNEYTTDLGGAVYGGTLDVVSGVLTVTWGYIASYNGETIGEPWMSNIDEYVAGTTPSIGAEVAYTLSTPQTIQLTSQEVETLVGDNNYISPQGNVVEVIYRADIPQEGTITLDTLGEANITYTATDDCGNSTEVERTIDIEQYRTVLYSDGTFIINERSSDIPANIAEHGTETATYDPLDENHDYHFATEPPWYSNRLLVTKVEIGSRIQPVYMDYWFTYFRNCTEFDLSNISVSYLSSADHTFNKCSSVEEIDISMLHNVTGTRSMFRDCSSLKTIYASDDFPAQTVSGTDTFNSCTQLVGGSGTTYDANHIDYTYAHIDGGTSNPGYFTAKGA